MVVTKAYRSPGPDGQLHLVPFEGGTTTEPHPPNHPSSKLYMPHQQQHNANASSTDVFNGSSTLLHSVVDSANMSNRTLSSHHQGGLHGMSTHDDPPTIPLNISNLEVSVDALRSLTQDTNTTSPKSLLDDGSATSAPMTAPATTIVIDLHANNHSSTRSPRAARGANVKFNLTTEGPVGGGSENSGPSKVPNIITSTTTHQVVVGSYQQQHTGGTATTPSDNSPPTGFLRPQRGGPALSTPFSASFETTPGDSPLSVASGVGGGGGAPLPSSTGSITTNTIAPSGSSALNVNHPHQGDGSRRVSFKTDSPASSTGGGSRSVISPTNSRGGGGASSQHNGRWGITPRLSIAFERSDNDACSHCYGTRVVNDASLLISEAVRTCGGKDLHGAVFNEELRGYLDGRYDRNIRSMLQTVDAASLIDIMANVLKQAAVITSTVNNRLIDPCTCGTVALGALVPGSPGVDGGGYYDHNNNRGGGGHTNHRRASRSPDCDLPLEAMASKGSGNDTAGSDSSSDAEDGMVTSSNSRRNNNNNNNNYNAATPVMATSATRIAVPKLNTYEAVSPLDEATNPITPTASGATRGGGGGGNPRDDPMSMSGVSSPTDLIIVAPSAPVGFNLAGRGAQPPSGRRNQQRHRSVNIHATIQNSNESPREGMTAARASPRNTDAPMYIYANLSNSVGVLATPTGGQLPPSNVGYGRSRRSLQPRQSLIVSTTLREEDDDVSGFELINQYLVMEEIGAGASGVVFAVCNTETNKDFALKVIKRERFRQDAANLTPRATPRVTTAMNREVAIMKKLRHPHLVRLHEVIDDSAVNKLYLVMTLLTGGQLCPSLDVATGECQPVAPHLMRRYVYQMCDGLRYLHQHNIIHRDVKPENMMLDGEGNVVLVDFGVSEVVDDDEGGVEGAVGTPAFMAPEVWDGDRVSGAAADVWSLGVSVFMMLVGHSPFYGKNRTELIHKVRTCAPSFPDDIDPEWRTLLTSMLAKDPATRISLSAVMRNKMFAEFSAPPPSGDSTSKDSRGHGHSSHSAAHRSVLRGAIVVTEEDVEGAIRERDEPMPVILEAAASNQNLLQSAAPQTQTATQHHAGAGANLSNHSTTTNVHSHHLGGMEWAQQQHTSYSIRSYDGEEDDTVGGNESVSGLGSSMSHSGRNMMEGSIRTYQLPEDKVSRAKMQARRRTIRDL